MGLARGRRVAVVVGLLALTLGPFPGVAAPPVLLEDAFPGVTFDRPLFAAQPPDGTPRMFVVEQGGRVYSWITRSRGRVEAALPRPLLRGPGRGNEEGLLASPSTPGTRRTGALRPHAATASGLRRHQVSGTGRAPPSRRRRPAARDRSW